MLVRIMRGVDDDMAASDGSVLAALAARFAPLVRDETGLSGRLGAPHKSLGPPGRAQHERGLSRQWASGGAAAAEWWAFGDGRPLPAEAVYPNPAEALGILSTAGTLDTRGHPFLEPLGANGRGCVTCHQPADAMALSAATIRAPGTRRRARTRCSRPSTGATARTCRPGTRPLQSPPPTVSVYQRPRPVANTKYLTHHNFGVGPCIAKSGLPATRDPETGLPTTMNRMAEARATTLKVQAQDAARAHPGLPGGLGAVGLERNGRRDSRGARGDRTRARGVHVPHVLHPRLDALEQRGPRQPREAHLLHVPRHAHDGHGRRERPDGHRDDDSAVSLQSAAESLDERQARASASRSPATPTCRRIRSSGA
jgi:hypothetical protein